MAWRIDKSVVRGEIDNREKGRVTGKLWLYGREEPVLLELTGNPWRDLAGQYLRFVNPEPEALPEHLQSFAQEQTGVVGDMTAARKVKILDIPDNQFEHYYRNKIPMPYHWGNSVYLEWHSVRNGRVVIESTDYQLTVEPEPTWTMSEEEEQAQGEANGRAMINFMETMLEAAEAEDPDEDTDEAFPEPAGFSEEELAGEAFTDEDWEPFPPTDEDAPRTRAEAEAEAEAARMDLLNDRINARLEREENVDADTIERIIDEERARLRRERGEPDPEPNPFFEQMEDPAAIDEWNAHVAEAFAREDDPIDDEEYPLVEACQELGRRIFQDIQDNEWLPEGAQEEHPLNGLAHGIWFAAAKLAGALVGGLAEWPPDALFAPNRLVRLKRARAYLKDARACLDAAESEGLCPQTWIDEQREALNPIRYEVQCLINELRYILNQADDEENPLGEPPDEDLECP